MINKNLVLLFVYSFYKLRIIVTSVANNTDRWWREQDDSLLQ